jgi:hypothetical protein
VAYKLALFLVPSKKRQSSGKPKALGHGCRFFEILSSGGKSGAFFGKVPLGATLIHERMHMLREMT